MFAVQFRTVHTVINILKYAVHARDTWLIRFVTTTVSFFVVSSAFALNKFFFRKKKRRTRKTGISGSLVPLPRKAYRVHLDVSFPRCCDEEERGQQERGRGRDNQKKPTTPNYKKNTFLSSLSDPLLMFLQTQTIPCRPTQSLTLQIFFSQ